MTIQTSPQAERHISIATIVFMVFLLFAGFAISLFGGLIWFIPLLLAGIPIFLVVWWVLRQRTDPYWRRRGSERSYPDQV
jgi:fatty acid desaturase